MKYASAFWASLLDLLFPPQCQVCRELQTQPLCPPCRQTIEWLHGPWCLCCGLPFDPLARGASICRGCRTEKHLPYRAVRSAAAFGGTLRIAIHRLKYEGKRSLAQPLGELMLEFVESQPEVRNTLAVPELDFIVPVPLHVRRHRQRGFNQSELLAEVLGRAWNVPVFPEALMRVRATTPQVRLSGKERQHNVQGAFAPAPDLDAQGATVLLVDDLYTTGATIRECARALHQKQIARIFVYTLAWALQEGV